MAEFKPDFNRLKKVLLRDGEPDIVPFYELFADLEIMQAVMDMPVDTPINEETIVKFYYKLGYDYAPIGCNFRYKTLHMEVKDTASLPREKRRYKGLNFNEMA